jgi:VanZ family protein
MWSCLRLSGDDPLPPRTLGLAAAGVVLVGSLLPAPPSDPSVTVAAFGLGVDKWVHAASYALVAGLAAASGQQRRRTLALIAVVVGVTAFGVGVEVAQSFVPGRTTSAADAVANAVGAAVGVTGWWLFVRRGRAETPLSQG